MPLIKAENLGVFKDKWLIRNVDLELRAGEIVTLVGPNGGGKTTLLRSLLGICPPSEGRVLTAAELRVGYMPQSPSINLTMPLTVEGFMLLSGDDKNEIKSKLEDCEVAHLKEKSLRQLSGGEFQRVQFARALLGKPNLLLLDEPTQKLDPGGELAIYKLINRAVKRLRCAALVASHDLHVVMSSSHRVICLNGHICCSGLPQEVQDDTEYRRLLGDSAEKVMALYSHHHDHRHD